MSPVLFDCVCFFWNTQLLAFDFIAYLSFNYLSIAVLALRASHFFATAQKSNQKRPLHIDCPAGSWIWAYCLRARFDAPSGRTKLNSPSMANLPYQYAQIQQSKRRGNSKEKNTNKTSIQQAHRFWPCPYSTLGKPFIRWGYHGSSVKSVWAPSASYFTAW